MKKTLKMGMQFTLLCALLCIASMAVFAQSGGGGSSSASTATPFVFDYVAPVNGVTPSCSGDFTLTNAIAGYYSWATVKISIKAKPINLPDYTLLNVTVYTSDAVTGEVYAPARMANMVVLKQVASVKSATNLYNSTFTQIVRQLDRIIVTTSDGTVVFSGHP